MDHSRIRRLLIYIGTFCCFLSFLALLLSLALPGVGWALAAPTVVATSLLVPFIGRRYAIITLIVGGIHLLTFGPLSLIAAGSHGKASTKFLLVFVIFPAAVAALSILVPILKARKRKSN